MLLIPHFGSYHCNYSYEDKNSAGSPMVTEGTTCFFLIYAHLVRNKCEAEDVKFSTAACKTDVLAIKSKNNICHLTKEEIIWYMDFLTKLVPFKYELKEEKREYNGTKFECWAVYVTAEKLTCLQFKYVSTCIRYMYEQNYNVILKDAILIQKMGLVKSKNFMNVHAVVQAAYSFEKNHAVDCSHEFYYPRNITDLKKAIAKKGDLRLNRINNYPDDNDNILHQIEVPHDVPAEEWFSFENVLKRYENTYSKFIPKYEEMEAKNKIKKVKFATVKMP